VGCENSFASKWTENRIVKKRIFLGCSMENARAHENGTVIT
jgi:hypothetical protein